MKYRKAMRLERPIQQAIAYSIHGLIFMALAFLSQEPFIVLLCAFLFCMAGIKAITLFSSAVFYRGEFPEKNFPHRIDGSRH